MSELYSNMVVVGVLSGFVGAAFYALAIWLGDGGRRARAGRKAEDKAKKKIEAEKKVEKELRHYKDRVAYVSTALKAHGFEDKDFGASFPLWLPTANVLNVLNANEQVTTDQRLGLQRIIQDRDSKIAELQQTIIGEQDYSKVKGRRIAELQQIIKDQKTAHIEDRASDANALTKLCIGLTERGLRGLDASSCVAALKALDQGDSKIDELRAKLCGQSIRLNGCLVKVGRAGSTNPMVTTETFNRRWDILETELIKLNRELAEAKTSNRSDTGQGGRCRDELVKCSGKLNECLARIGKREYREPHFAGFLSITSFDQRWKVLKEQIGKLMKLKASSSADDMNSTPALVVIKKCLKLIERSDVVDPTATTKEHWEELEQQLKALSDRNDRGVIQLRSIRNILGEAMNYIPREDYSPNELAEKAAKLLRGLIEKPAEIRNAIPLKGKCQAFSKGFDGCPCILCTIDRAAEQEYNSTS